MTFKEFRNYLSFLLFLYIFHLLSWNLNNYFEISYSLYFLSQFLIYSIIYLIIFRKNYFYVPLSLPLVFLYLISVVAFIDRSLTVEMMIYYLNNPNSTYLDLFEIEKLTTDYLIEKRINEQLNTGLINFANNEINLSYRGKVFANIYKVLSSFYK